VLSRVLILPALFVLTLFVPGAPAAQPAPEVATCVRSTITRVLKAPFIPVRDRTTPAIEGGFLRAAPEKGSAWLFGWPVRRVVQAPVRKVTERIYGTPHEFELVDGMWRLLERKTLKPGREFKSGHKMVGTIAIGIGSAMVLPGALAHPYDYHPLYLTADKVVNLIRMNRLYKREAEIQHRIETDYRYRGIRDLKRAGKLSRDAQLFMAEATRLGLRDLNVWLEKMNKKLEAGEMTPGDALADLIMEADPDEPLFFRAVPTAHLSQFWTGEWEDSGLFKKVDPNSSIFTLEQIQTIYQFEFDKIYAMSRAEAHFTQGADLSQEGDENPILKNLLSDPYVKYLTSLNAKISGEKLIELVHEDIDWKFRFEQLRVLGLQQIDPKAPAQPMTLADVRASVLKREGLPIPPEPRAQSQAAKPKTRSSRRP
jgi:hypothetical protein